MRNAEVAAVLEQIADLLDLRGENTFKVGAYREAARVISTMGTAIEDWWKAGKLQDISGVGPSISAKIDEVLRTGRSLYCESLEAELPLGALALMEVPGVGPKRARMLADRLHIRSISDLIQAAEAHELQHVPGLGERTEEQILKEARRHTERTRRIPLFVAWPLSEEVASHLREHPAVKAAEPAGSIRRRLETIGDIDLLVASDEPQAVLEYLVHLPLVHEVLLRGPTKCSILTRTNLQVDVRVVPPVCWGAALQYFTGSKAHNIHLRQIAISQGKKISEYGLFEADTGARLAGATEGEIYEALGLPWIPAEIREDTGEIEAASANRLPRLVLETDVKGDFHTHSTYSDGHNSVEAMAIAARSRGYEWLVVSDHSAGLAVATGLDLKKALEQREEIARLNAKLAPFRVLQGLEVEIRQDGSLDFSDEILAAFDVVAASLHVGTRSPTAQNTRRLVLALGDSEVDGLNHPTGQVVGRRDPYEVEIQQILEAAKRYGKALEINGSERLDLPSSLARQARDLGLFFTLGTDAHRVEELDRMRYAVAIARRAWVEKEHVLNTLSARQLKSRLASTRRDRGIMVAHETPDAYRKRTH